MEVNADENHWKLGYLKNLYELVSHHSHIPIPPHHPLVGKNAFTHYAGVHVTAMAKDESLYQSLDPKILGIKSNFALGMQSGLSAVALALKQIGREDLAQNKDLIARILQEIKKIAKRGTPIDIEKELPTIIQSCCITNLSPSQEIHLNIEEELLEIEGENLPNTQAIPNGRYPVSV
jgi:2-isopropylmalate synthase